MSVVHAAEVNTWPTIPRIRAHCLVETTLERCVQRLRKRMTEESEAAQLQAMQEQQQHGVSRGKKHGGLRDKDRTPSFYTSKSLVNLSGLSVSDPAPIQSKYWQHNTKGSGSRDNLAGAAGSHHNAMNFSTPFFIIILYCVKVTYLLYILYLITCHCILLYFYSKRRTFL